LKKDILCTLAVHGGSILSYLAVIWLIWMVLYDVFIPIFSEGTPVNINALIDKLPSIAGVIIVAIIMMVIGDYIANLGNKMRNELEEYIVGYVEATPGPIKITEIGEKLAITRKGTLKMLLKIKAKGKLKEFYIDTEKEEIFKETPHAYPLSTTTATDRRTTREEIREEIQIKARLIELEELKKEGKISERAYLRLKSELEEKLKQV